MKPFLAAGAAGLALSLAGAASASSLNVTFGGQIDPATAPKVAPPVYDPSSAVVVPAGRDSTYDGWDPYGDTAGGWTTTDETHPWLSIADGGSAWVDANGKLTLVWGSVNDWPAPGNVIDFYDKATLVGEVGPRESSTGRWIFRCPTPAPRATASRLPATSPRRS